MEVRVNSSGMCAGLLRRAGARAFEWLTRKRVAECQDVHEQLLQTLPDDPAVATVCGMWTLVLPAVAIGVTASAWGWWMLYGMALLTALRVRLAMRHAQATRKEGRSARAALLAAEFASHFGTGLCIYLAYSEGNLVLAILAMAVAMAFNGYIGTRLVAFPRFSFLMHGVIGGFLAAGFYVSPLPGAEMLFWFIPPGLLASLVLFRMSHLKLLGIVRSQHENRRQAVHDPLTGLANRLLLSERLAELSARVSTDDQTHLALLALDLDGFKATNDSLGHDAGDRLLEGVASRLAGAVRETDLAARVGGDEFVVLLPGVGEIEACETARRIIDAVQEPMEVRHGIVLYPRISVGVALSSRDGRSMDGLLSAADKALYLAKGAGKGRWATSAGVTEHVVDTKPNARALTAPSSDG